MPRRVAPSSVALVRQCLLLCVIWLREVCQLVLHGPVLGEHEGGGQVSLCIWTDPAGKIPDDSTGDSHTPRCCPDQAVVHGFAKVGCQHRCW